jgi:DNA-binding LytR/AlgR family response regulator
MSPVLPSDGPRPPWYLPPGDAVEFTRAVASFAQRLGQQTTTRRQHRRGEDSHIGDTGAMAVPTADGLKLVQVNAIRWAQAKGDYVRLHTGDGNHLIRASISWLADTLAALGMVRIHRSFLVQPRLIQMIRREPSGALAAVIDGHLLPISRRRAEALRLRLGLVAPT